jgi:hypothetical protein
VPRKQGVLLLVLVVLMSLWAAGCGKKAEPAGETGVQTTAEQAQKGEVAGTQAGKAVLINGRSVAQGWMKHWGYESAGPVEKSGYSLDYKELNADDMAGSFRKNVSGLPAGSIVFFKFCFADFNGANLTEIENTIDKVIGIAR